jgi:hypothetical protein
VSWRYTLAYPFAFLPSHRAAGNFDNRFLSIIRGAGLTVWPGYSHDGYTCWPDPPEDVGALAAAMHDACYQYMEDIVRAFNAQGIAWTKARFREWADLCFYEAMIYRGVPAGKAALIYRGVRWFGGIFHEVRRWFRGGSK